MVGQQPFGGARASGTNDKAGSMWNLIRWVSPRTIKETLRAADATSATRSWRRTSRPMAASRVSALAGRMAGLRPSTIRGILKVTAQPEVISFAGGLPAPELFPIDEVREVADRVLRELGSEALQYGESEGFRPLREWIVGEMCARGVETTVDQVVTQRLAACRSRRQGVARLW